MDGFQIRTILFIIMMAAAAIAHDAGSARAADFCVTTATDLQGALTAAGGNGEDDEIHLVQGEYVGSFTFATHEAHRLEIKGGYIGADCASRTLSASNTVLNGNSAGRVLSAEIGVSADFECEGLTFQNGLAETGGGLAVSTPGNVTLSKNKFLQNEASESGGGLHISSESGGAATIRNNTVSDNKAGSGGGMHLDLYSAYLQINIISSNDADLDAGGALIDCDSSTIVNNIISRNDAVRNAGGIRISGGSAVLSGNSFSGNSAGGDGGGAWSDSDSFSMADSSFGGNRAGFDAGAVYTARGSVGMDDNRFTGNTADNDGGALHVMGNPVSINGNTLLMNMASNNGGAIYASEGSVAITNNVINGNTASGESGGIRTGCDSASIVNNTITENKAMGGPGAGVSILLQDDSDAAALRNNIIHQNSGYTSGNDLHIENDRDGNQTPSPTTLVSNLFDQSPGGALISLPFTIGGSNLNNPDPLFVDSSSDNFRLMKGSPCIDAGSATGAPSLDIDGVSRPRGRTHDIGAYEYEGEPSVFIRANGSDEDIIATGEHALEISGSVDPDILTDQDAEWWMLHLTPDGALYFLASTAGVMAPASSLSNVAPFSQMSLRRLDDVTLLTLPCPEIGAHFFAFAVDLDKNGYLDSTSLYFDIIRVDRVFVDADGDGFHSDGSCETIQDCDDSDPSIRPGGLEICDDGIDQDCNGVDFDCRDVDNDGDGFTENLGDCDDASASVHPGAGEIRDDGVDQDCDGSDLFGAAVDDDGDGYTENQGDCNDAAASIYPGAPEVQDDGVDQDCDGGDLLGAGLDDDGDGYSENQGDCNDADDSVHPGAAEVRDDGIDQDCNGSDLQAVAIDDDGDGYSENQGDCNDDDPSFHPGATDVCDDGIDQDCNGVDADCNDVDNDGDGYSENQGDCNDAAGSIHPSAPDIPNDGIDQDCNGYDFVHDNP